MKYILTIILALVAFVGVAQTRFEIVAGKNYDMERQEWKQAVELNGYLEASPGQITLYIEGGVFVTRRVKVTQESTKSDDGYVYFIFVDEVGVNYAIVITPQDTLELWVESTNGKSKFLLRDENYIRSSGTSI